MTDYEYQKLQNAYEETMSRTGEEEEFGQEEYLMYGSYEPLTVTITHILNNKSGINFASYAHTGLPVEVFAMGAGQEQFEGYYDKLIGQIGNDGSTFQSASETLTGALSSIDNQRQQTMGVSSDEELTHMIKFQSAYNASSRFMTVISQMTELIVTGLK